MTGLKNLSVEDARARMLAVAAPLGAEQVALAQSLGRSLAAPITALRDQPPFDASAMDGWAIRRADLATVESFRIAGESAAGNPHHGVLAAGQAVRVLANNPAADALLHTPYRDGWTL